MQDSQFNIERATNGLILALFLASSILLVVLLWRVLDDIEKRQAESSTPPSAQVLVTERASHT